MFGHRFFGKRYYGQRYFGGIGQTPPPSVGLVQMVKTLQRLGE